MLAPATPPLAFGPWQAQFGQAGSDEHYSNYLQDNYYGYPFGLLPAVDGLPDEVAGQPLSCGLVDELLTHVLKSAGWVQQVDVEYPPALESPYPVACLAYFAHSLRVDGQVLTTGQVLRGFALALPYWPGLFGITSATDAVGAMRELLDADTSEFILHQQPNLVYETILPRLYAWADQAVQYGLFGEVRYK